MYAQESKHVLLQLWMEASDDLLSRGPGIHAKSNDGNDHALGKQQRLMIKARTKNFHLSRSPTVSCTPSPCSRPKKKEREKKEASVTFHGPKLHPSIHPSIHPSPHCTSGNRTAISPL
jgi:hypothetical protein